MAGDWREIYYLELEKEMNAALLMWPWSFVGITIKPRLYCYWSFLRGLD